MSEKMKRVEQQALRAKLLPKIIEAMPLRTWEQVSQIASVPVSVGTKTTKSAAEHAEIIFKWAKSLAQDSMEKWKTELAKEQAKSPKNAEIIADCEAKFNRQVKALKKLDDAYQAMASTERGFSGEDIATILGA